MSTAYPARTLTMATAVAAAMLSATSPAAAAGAAADEPFRGRWTLRLLALAFEPDESSVAVDRDGPSGGERLVRSTVDGGGGLGIDLEYRFSRRLGIEASTFYTEATQEFRLQRNGVVVVDEEDVSVDAFSIGINYHLFPQRRLDFSLGMSVGFLYFGDVFFFEETGSEEKIAFDDDFGLGLQAAVDVPLGSRGRWMLSAVVRYLDRIMESEVAGQDLEVDPLVLGLGMGVRF